jgi:hypothetical protein
MITPSGRKVIAGEEGKRETQRNSETEKQRNSVNSGHLVP